MNNPSQGASAPESWSVEWVGPLPTHDDNVRAQPPDNPSLSHVHLGLVIAGAVLLGLSLLLW